MLNNAESKKLFAKSVPVTIKDVFTQHSRTCKLFLTVEWAEVTAGICKRELVISLTDENDPFFLHNLHLSEEDFQILKVNQGLLVDFPAFSQKFIDLVELCIAEGNKMQ
ncbi:Spindle assembly abnormal protein 6-like protein, partial [Stegodyphus mimosarum]